MADQTNQREPWHLDRKVPLAFIFAIFVQTVVAGIFIGELRSTLTAVASRVEKLEAYDLAQSTNDRAVSERLARIETNITNIDRTLTRVDSTIDRLANSQRQGAPR
jgi:hypothetical protein